MEANFPQIAAGARASLSLPFFSLLLPLPSSLSFFYGLNPNVSGKRVISRKIRSDSG